MDVCIVAREEGSVWEMETGRPATFKLLSGQTGERVATFEEVVPSGGGVPAHIHHTSDETIYVVAGELLFRIQEDLRTASAGAWIFIPRGTVHVWKNSGSQPAHLLFFFTPAEGAKVFEELRLLQVPVQSIAPDVLEAACRRFGYELVGPPL